MSTIMRKMNVISRCEAIYRGQQLPGELPGIYHSYILTISRSPGMTQDWLARYLCVNKSSVTRHLSHLEKEGYIERSKIQLMLSMQLFSLYSYLSPFLFLL